LLAIARFLLGCKSIDGFELADFVSAANVFRALIVVVAIGIVSARSRGRQGIGPELIERARRGLRDDCGNEERSEERREDPRARGHGRLVIAVVVGHRCGIEKRLRL